MEKNRSPSKQNQDSILPTRRGSMGTANTNIKKIPDPSKSASPYPKEFLLELMNSMLLIRRFEERAGVLYGLQKIGGFCHLYNGQEAVAVGSIATLDLKKDYVITAYRDHGHGLTVGMEPKSIMAELFGKATGCSKGKGGSMHMFDAEKHFLGGHGIVGGHLPLATGFAYKIMYNEEKGVVLCYFGDGAIHQGAFHESLNLAKIWNLPIIFICENNQYGMGTDFRRVSSQTNYAKMADSYNMPGEQIDGMNVLTIYDRVKEHVQNARDNGVPALLEIQTYRYRGHSMSDPAKYRSKEEVKEFRERDPVTQLKGYLIDHKIFTEDDYKDLDKKIKAKIEEAVKFAEESPEPEPKELYTDVLVDEE